MCIVLTVRGGGVILTPWVSWADRRMLVPSIPPIGEEGGCNIFILPLPFCVTPLEFWHVSTA